MKNKFILIFFLVFLITNSILGLSTPSITLNGLHYESKYPIIVKDNTPFIAIETLGDLTTSPIETNNTYTISLNGKLIKLSPLQPQITIGAKKETLPASPFWSQGTLYIPITLLDYINYPYTWENGTLSLLSPIPYSQNTDSPTDHIFLESIPNLVKYPNYINTMASQDFMSQSLTQTLESHSYLAFMDTTYKQEVYKRLKNKLLTSPYNNMEIALRTLNMGSEYPTLSPYTIKPFSISLLDTSLSFNIEGQSLGYDNIWSTFLPSQSLTKLDLDKTIDTTIMRVLYQYYRDSNNLKDDTFFSPLYMLTNNRTNTFNQKVYTSIRTTQDIVSTPLTHEYTVSIHRVHTTGKLTYVIDILLNE
ncbi:MAG: stalk domain-containing protein [Cellulosilyticaceae bacterium]